MHHDESGADDERDETRTTDPDLRRVARDGLRSPRAPHPELPDGWYFDDDEAAKAWDGDSDPVAAVAHQTRLFEEPEILIGRYTPQQIGFGLNFLRKASHSSHVRAFVDSRVPLELRVRGVRAVGQLYEKLLAAIIDPASSILETSSRGETDCCVARPSALLVAREMAKARVRSCAAGRERLKGKGESCPANFENS